MKIYKIPVVWQMMGHVEVEAENIEDACDLAYESKLPEKGNFLDDSFGLDQIGVEELIEDTDEDDFEPSTLEGYWR